MKYDKSIVWRLNHLPDEAKEEIKLEDLIERYYVCCRLSRTSSTNPQAQERARYWDRKAPPIWEEINRILERWPVAAPKLKTREEVVGDV